ncbi:hypothetical protein MMC17_010125 [Xylographa soralifera]|nr:hypothetical protein [Xylographa soralifera]
MWFEVSKQSDCKAAGSEVAAYNLPSNDLKTDRTTFCPIFFTIIQSPEAGPSITNLDPAKDIQVDTKLKDFTRKAGRIFLHEHLHTWTFNQIADNTKKRKLLQSLINDVDKPNSYGPDNAKRLASGVSTQDKASRNIDNVVYWCIAMYYSTWDWSTLSAATLTDKTPAPASSPKAAVQTMPKAQPKSKAESKPAPTKMSKPATKLRPEK